MGNQQTSSYPLCSIQYDCERNKYDRKLTNQNQLQGESQQDEQYNQELTDDYFGKVIVITKKYALSQNKSNLSGNLDQNIYSDQVSKDNQHQQTSSCLIIEKTFQDQNQLNEALKSVNLLQKITHPNIINIQSTQTVSTTNQHNDKLFVGRVQCEYYSENLLSILKKRKLTISQLSQKFSIQQNRDKQQEQSTPNSTQRSHSSQKKQSQQTYKKNPSCHSTPRGNQNNYVPAFTEKEIWYIIDSVVDTLNLLQQKSIIHGDLRPQTIFFTHEGHLKLSIVQCFNKDFSHTNFHIAAHHILKKKQLQQKIQEDNILLSLEQLNQLQRLNPVTQDYKTQQTKNSAKQILSNLEYDPYKSQVFSFGILLLQIIFCGNVECSQFQQSSQHFQQKISLNQAEKYPLQNVKYLYTTNEKTKEVTINFQLIFDLLQQVKQLFSFSLYQILSACLEIKEQDRPNCIQLYNQLHDLDLQTEASLTMDEFVTIKLPLQLDYQQNLSQKLRNPSLDLSTLEKTPKQDQKSNPTCEGITLLKNNLFSKSKQFENLSYSNSPKINLTDINLNQNLFSKTYSNKKMNQISQTELLKSPSHPKEMENQKKLNNSQKNVQIDIIQRSNNKDEILYQNINKQNNLFSKSSVVQNEVTPVNKMQQIIQQPQQVQNKNQKENQFDLKEQLELDYKNYQSILKHKSYSLVQSYQSKTSKDIKNQITNIQQSKTMKQQPNQISIPCFKISECKFQNQDLNQLKDVSLLIDKNNNDVNKNQSENTQKINLQNTNNKYSSQFCPILSQQLLNNKQITTKNESVIDNRISNISDNPTQNSRKEQSISNHQKDCFNLNKDIISVCNQSIIKDNNIYLNQNQTTMMTTGRRQSESSTTNQSLSTTFQFYSPLTNQAVTSFKNPELSHPSNIGHQKSYSFNLNLNNDLLVYNPYENKNFSLLNTQEEKKGTELQKQYESSQDKGSINTEYLSKQNISYLSNDQNLHLSKLQSPQQSPYSFNKLNLLNSNNHSQVYQNNQAVQQRSITLIDNFTLKDKQNTTQFYQKDLQSQIKNINQLNSTTIDNSHSFLSSQNFKSDLFQQQINYQPNSSLQNTVLKSPQSQNIVKFNEQILQQSQIIHQSIDLNESQFKKYLGESGVNINANTYTFSSPQNQRFEELKNSQQYFSDEKVKHASISKTYYNQNSIENPLQQTAKFINESSRHQFSTSIQEKISKQDTLKDEKIEECLSHVYGSPQRVIVSRSNIQSPLNYIQSPITQRNKSHDYYNKSINQIGSEIHSQKNLTLKQNDQNNSNNSKTLIILSPQKNISTNSKLATTPPGFENEKSYLNHLVKNDDLQQQSSLISHVNNRKEKQICEIFHNNQNITQFQQLDTFDNEDIGKNIEIEEWNDIESQMSENLYNSTSECIKVNNILLNTNTKVLSSLMIQNKQQSSNQIEKQNQSTDMTKKQNMTAKQNSNDNEKNKNDQTKKCKQIKQ